MAGQNNGKQGGQQQDVNQLLKVRREKLANLQEAGQDPFQITKYDVTHHTSDVKDLYNAHEEKLLAGRPAVNTDGMDEAAAREAVKADYEERRSIMDADPTPRIHRRTYDVQARHGKSIFRKHSGSQGKHPDLCCA